MDEFVNTVNKRNFSMITIASNFGPTHAAMSQNDSSSRNDMAEGLPYKAWEMYLLVCVYAALITATLVGNTMVGAAVFYVRKLRNPPNYLLVSLAFVDFMVGLTVMPFAAMYHIFGSWDFGMHLCVGWTTADVFLCTASILNLCAISVDRYCAINNPLTYVPKRTSKRIAVYILIVWLLAAFISVAPIFVFKPSSSSTPHEGVCQINQNIGYQIYATVGAFYLPVAIMLVVNYKIFQTAARHTKKDTLEFREGCSVTESHSAFSTPVQSKKRSVHASPPSHRRKRSEMSGYHTQRTAKNSLVALTRKSSSKIILSMAQKVSQLWPDMVAFRSYQLVLTETRAAKTLSIIMGAFIFCWLPFFIVALVKPTCGQRCHVPDWLDSLTLWLGYINSSINPVLYAIFNRDFRIPFREMICFRCRNLQRVLRSETFNEIYGHHADLENHNHDHAAESVKICRTTSTVITPETKLSEDNLLKKESPIISPSRERIHEKVTAC